ncbi:MAG: iron-sulfur cluster biosynthesis family protein [Paenibacillaceae bacterium]
MTIIPTQEALDKLLHMFPSEQPTIKIVYDTEGCGCAVNGVVQLWRTDGMSSEDEIGYDQDIRIVYAARQEVFFEDQLTLGYNKIGRAFELKSKSQIYNSSIPLIDKTGGSPE